MHTIVRNVESLDEIYLVEYKVLSLVFQVSTETCTASHEVLKNTDFPFVYGSVKRLLNLSYEIAAH